MSKETDEAAAFFGRPDFARGKYGWAEITQPDGDTKLYRRATTIAGYMEDKEGLISWMSAMTAFGLLKSKSLQMSLSLLSWKEDKAKVKDIVARAKSFGGGDDAADIGTAFHRLIERYVAGEEIDRDLLPEGFGEALDAWIAYQSQNGITVEASELTVVDDAHQIAGTADAVFSFAEDVRTPFGVVKAGQGIIGDFKTGSVSELSGLKMSQQLSIYSHATPYDAGRNVRTDWPLEINPDIGLILKVDLDNAKIIPWWLDLKSAYEWIDLSLKVSATRTAAKKAIVQEDVTKSKGTIQKPQDGALGAREVGKLITAATSRAELQKIHREHGDAFTDAMTERWQKKAAELGGDTDEAPAEPEAKADPAELNKLLGAATTIDELKAIYDEHGKSMTKDQKLYVKGQVEKFKAAAEAEETPAPAAEPEEPKVEETPAPAAGNETQVQLPDWALEDDETEAKPEPYSVEDARQRAAEVGTKGELKQLYIEFARQAKSGKDVEEALVVISARASELK